MRKIAILCTALIGGLSLASVSAPVSAQPGGYYLYEYTYYSDAALTNSVGILSEHCYEPATLSGEITPYYTRVRSGYFSYSGGCQEY